MGSLLKGLTQILFIGVSAFNIDKQFNVNVDGLVWLLPLNFICGCMFGVIFFLHVKDQHINTGSKIQES